MSRRSPSGDQRRRDAERTRERILDAALVEFGEHGFAGARTSAIAARAGVNQQLISYYFAGKEGLYQALQERWRTTSGAARPDEPMADVVAGFLRLGATQRSWARLLAWEGLADTGAAADTADEAQARTYFTAMVDDVRRRQRSGELAVDLDPAYVVLTFFAATLAPTVLPQVVRRLTGLPADAPEFLDAYAAQLRRMLGHLSGSAAPPE
ncbi:TetR family transcriptional regulator [Micromonospora sp. A3M-1-15]|uniref:TetR/AcrR family transcriptional regulator n=1 Tax=Micromonospora sp. A3M-1-15 TaxID=2962035 RepID=UPI0020B7099D|nr:TetR/AcrR family transcriptional regulator [Micromonospora sp. A3M-1-15]MCP3782849.1 TetR family transcriptional regulator [Micromonospora sp. A3M-1-15]